MKTKYNKAYRAVYTLTAHVVLVTKYRKAVFTDKLLTELETVGGVTIEQLRKYVKQQNRPSP